MGKLAIITGASRGIGLATAKKFLASGWSVINLSRSPCPEPAVMSIICDLEKSLSSSVVQALNLAAANQDKISLIHNAHVLSKGSVQTVSEAVVLKELQFAVMQPITLNQALFPYLKAGSSVIYVGSTLSEIAVKNTAAYVIAKHAMLGLMRATCQDFDNTGVHTAIVCPGFTDTEMLHSHIGADSEIIQALKNQVSFKRFITPNEIASLIFFAAENPVINGGILHANLGQLN